jgi:hypothetical protein
VRARDLEPGRRVRLPRRRDLCVVVDVSQDEYGTCLVTTDVGVCPCNLNTLFDAEDETSEVMP